jgi:hypothetical protein
MILDLFRNEVEFNDIQGYDGYIVRRVLDAEDNYLLFVGPPASAKTLFLLGILESRKRKGMYFDGSNTTNILDVLEEKRPKIICIDGQFKTAAEINLNIQRIHNTFKLN